MTLVTIREDGTLACVGGDDLPLPALGEVTRTRASRILPTNPLKRLAFRALRLAFGDAGRAAAWTRAWRGPWEATILSTRERFQHPDRATCLRWERARLEKGAC